jgi:hypothetical protein
VLGSDVHRCSAALRHAGVQNLRAAPPLESRKRQTWSPLRWESIALWTDNEQLHARAWGKLIGADGGPSLSGRKKVDEIVRLTLAIARRLDVLTAQIAEAGEIGMSDFLDLNADRVLAPLCGDRTMTPVGPSDDVLWGFIA